jgi:hypothetical protein
VLHETRYEHDQDRNDEERDQHEYQR